MAAFEGGGANLHVRFEPEEASLLRSLLDELEQVLTRGLSDDPVSARLFPKAYETEEEQSAYEELMGDQLSDEKLRALRDVRLTLTGDEFELEESLLHFWVVVLTDLRLAIGARLEVTEETMERDLDPEDPESPALSVLHWLGWVQESMLSHLTKQ